mmetsp:Transcript_37568/g.74625  ORF Transcript_37568/g.74625 Transcript_37568/m.74625 type:complete len:84 (+) Transcript_37568:217-468(+)
MQVLDYKATSNARHIFPTFYRTTMLEISSCLLSLRNHSFESHFVPSEVISVSVQFEQCKSWFRIRSLMQQPIEQPRLIACERS